VRGEGRDERGESRERRGEKEGRGEKGAALPPRPLDGGAGGWARTGAPVQLAWNEPPCRDAVRDRVFDSMLGDVTGEVSA